MFKVIAVSLVVSSISLAFGAEENPYCLSGANWAKNGVLARMGLPGEQDTLEGSIGYIWDSLQPTNIPNMVRPKRYWEFTGVHRILFQGYDHEKNEILDATIFDEWVKGNPGRVWIIGNEVNHHPQDGLSPTEYARMFHLYYDFIKVQGRDPSAKFAIGSCLALSDGDWISNNTNYWNEALAEYRKQFDAEMPIDIWNNHCYAPAGALDPDGMIENFFKPFREYVDTVSGGIYEDKPIWCTEFGVSMWATPLHPDYVAEFVEQLCPRLEQKYELKTGKKKRVLDRWFWFIAQGEKGAFRDSAFLAPGGGLTKAGEVYLNLAGNLPNPVPPPPESPKPPPPSTLTFDFDRGLKPWRPWAGDWSSAWGVCQHVLREVDPKWGTHLHLPYWYRDFSIETDVRIRKANHEKAYAGFFLRHGTVWQDGREGYGVAIRKDGSIVLSSTKHKEIRAVEGAVEDVADVHRLGATFRGNHVEVTLDGTTVITWDDPDNYRTEGLVSLSAGLSDASFDNVEVTVP